MKQHALYYPKDAVVGNVIQVGDLTVEDAIAHFERTLFAKLYPVSDEAITRHLNTEMHRRIFLDNALYEVVSHHDGEKATVKAAVRIHTAESEHREGLVVITDSQLKLAEELRYMMNRNLEPMPTPPVDQVIPYPYLSITMPYSGEYFYRIHPKAAPAPQIDLGDALAVWEWVFIRMDNSKPDSMSAEDHTIRNYWESYREEVGIVQMREESAGMAPALSEAFITLCDVWDNEDHTLNLPRAHAFDLEFIPQILDWMVLNDFDPLVSISKKDVLSAADTVYPRPKGFIVEIDVFSGQSRDEVETMLQAVLAQKGGGARVVEVIEKEQ